MDIATEENAACEEPRFPLTDGRQCMLLAGQCSGACSIANAETIKLLIDFLKRSVIKCGILTDKGIPRHTARL